MPPTEQQRTEKQRSLLQNNSLHKLFADISRYCIENNIDMKTIMEHMKKYRCEASPTAIKSVWKDIQFSITKKNSTTELETNEVDEVYEEFNKFISEVTKEHFPFPSMESLMFNSLEDTI